MPCATKYMRFSGNTRIVGEKYMICFKGLRATRQTTSDGLLPLVGALGPHWLHRTSLKVVAGPVTVVAPTTQRYVAEVEWGSGTI